MPLDGHSYLLAQGWAGKGKGLRQGAITRPLAIPQKKSLSGLGKDRNEAFPFWDHLFLAAAKSIQLKVTSSDDDVSDAGLPKPVYARTTTGILSNRRPVAGLLASESGTTTPDSNDGPPRQNLLSLAKREAAKGSLYARFFRGPVLGPDNVFPSTQTQQSATIEVTSTKTFDERVHTESSEISSKKRKRNDRGYDSELTGENEREKGECKARKFWKSEESIKEREKKERKRLKKELKEKARAESKCLVGGDLPHERVEFRDERGKGEAKMSNEVVGRSHLPSVALSPHEDHCLSGKGLDVDTTMGELAKEKKRKRKES